MLDSAAVSGGRMLRTFLCCLVSLLDLVILSSCRRQEAAWSRIDLWLQPPTIEQPATAPGSERPVHQRITPLSADEVRDLAKVNSQQLLILPHESGGQIRALETHPPCRLRWQVQLGRDPYLSFIPLGTRHGCVGCQYRVGVRSQGKVTELLKTPVAAVPRFAPATQEIDLAPWAGSEVDILMTLDPGPASTASDLALWGSPAVYSRATVPQGRKPAHPNVLLIGIDTLRADELGAWGHRPTITPALDGLAAESDVWLDAYTVFNVTNPSFVSILTGLYGRSHGVFDLKTPLPREIPTLATVLHDAGYATLSIISARHLGPQNSGLDRGFDDVTRADEHFAGELATDMTIDWISSHTADPATSRPFFVWLHLYDAHTPHTPPQPYAQGLRPAAATGLLPVRSWVPFRALGPRDFVQPALAGNRDLYDGQVAYVDHQVGRLLDLLRSRDLLGDTIVVLVADHGENLGDHGFMFRHVGLFDTTTHVPMMIRWPAATPRGQRLHGLVETIDLFPTLLRRLAIAAPPSEGTDLRILTGSEAQPRPGRRAVFADHSDRYGATVRTTDYRYVFNHGNKVIPDGPCLYDEHADPSESHNLAGENLPIERQLAKWLAAWQTQPLRHTQTHAVPLSKEDVDRLRALGYGAGAGTSPDR
jgi:arylsulfatase